jgi:hypothetical protein
MGGIRRGYVSPVAVTALREVFPRLYAMLQQEIIEQASIAARPPPFATQQLIATVFNIQLDGTLAPEYAASRQAEYAAAAAAAPPPPGGPQIKLSSQSELGAVRRAMR